MYNIFPNYHRQPFQFVWIKFVAMYRHEFNAVKTCETKKKTKWTNLMKKLRSKK
jgi:hypothetical protein